jgi:hypothetical protein
MNLVIGLTISLVVLGGMQAESANSGLAILTPAAVVQTALLSFFVGFCFTDLVPALDWGMRLATLLRLRNYLAVHIVRSAVLGLCMASAITFFCSLINNLAGDGMVGVFGFFLAWYPKIIGLAVLCIFVLFVPCSRLAARVSGFNPNAVDPNHN